MEKKGNHTAAKASTASILSVAMVLFASHAGGGFATGNQENTYFVCSGWAGLLSLALSMAILTGIIAIAMRLYNKYDLHSYKELFEKLYHPFDKLELVFELFFYVMVIMAVSIAMSLPPPIAMPRSACARAALSLIPSPAIATLWPAF